MFPTNVQDEEQRKTILANSENINKLMRQSTIRAGKVQTVMNKKITKNYDAIKELDDADERIDKVVKKAIVKNAGQGISKNMSLDPEMRNLVM